MAITIIATPGAGNANSYGTHEEMLDYFSAHLYASGFLNANVEKQKASMVLGCRFLDVMPGAWNGKASSVTQRLGFPRTGLTTRNGYPLESGAIPYDLKCAQFEYAKALYDSNLLETNDVVAQGITSLKAGPVELKFKDPLSQQQIDNPSNRALGSMVPDVVKALIVDSWLIPVVDQQVAEKPRPFIKAL